MHDFGEFCYLDVPKTGSSFVSRFLNKHSTLKQVEFRKHGRLHDKERMQPGKFFFITVREPVDQYKSLYFYGVNQRGGLFSQIRQEDDHLDRFYDGTASGFSSWLDVVMDPKYLPLFSPRPPEKGRLFGPMTDRFLRLSFFRPGKLLRRPRTSRALSTSTKKTEFIARSSGTSRSTMTWPLWLRGRCGRS